MEPLINALRGLILSRGYAAEAMARTDGAMTRLGLTLNRGKTRLCDARQERFDFLGYSFGPQPDAGKPHVRFDEQKEETGCSGSTARFLDSTVEIPA